jgi:hypothetical protein
VLAAMHEITQKIEQQKTRDKTQRRIGIDPPSWPIARPLRVEGGTVPPART